ncbi:MAG TPA: CRISPR system precrRNA processing endoribonuclease RAMP protein Cas6 [Smithella sp.]|nr:CRISPR system precrRNA processing endoribonuclease RAMP protein Cas6 [Smithella sp.]HQG66312.1 CRISPR system precrRNA processing endoribonuclease RAMP protein Cas6 [Smithella sp.]
MHYGRYIFKCVFDDNAVLPPYKGSTLRGIFGHALKKVVCALKKQDCADCLLAQRCIYTSIFESTIHPNHNISVRRVVHPPHPYVIEPPDDAKTNYQKDDVLNFVILLFGKANECLPYFIYAFDQMGQIGIGKRIDGKRASFVLKQVLVNEDLIYDQKDGKIRKQPALDNIAIEPDSVLQCDQEMIIKLKLSTPLRIKYHNNLKAELPFHILVRAMLRRISSLSESHDGVEPALDYRGMVSRAEKVTIEQSDLSWFDWRRYSNRQEQEMLMGGMIGSIEYRGKLSEYLPLINFCEKVHIGKQTTFGLGKVVLENVQKI